MAIKEDRDTVKIRDGAYSEIYYIRGVLEGAVIGTVGEVHFNLVPQRGRSRFMAVFYGSPEDIDIMQSVPRVILEYDSHNPNAVSFRMLENLHVSQEYYVPRVVKVEHKEGIEWFGEYAERFGKIGLALRALDTMKSGGYLDEKERRFESLYDEWKKGMEKRGIRIAAVDL
ncbi:MAG: hypothetical protein HYT73_04685 [Candidatus Aenigmarchaeota archaeon]|nr:hypothetical protein [Candidatus Aenigmarchaeota archaeon]